MLWGDHRSIIELKKTSSTAGRPKVKVNQGWGERKAERSRSSYGELSGGEYISARRFKEAIQDDGENKRNQSGRVIMGA